MSYQNTSGSGSSPGFVYFNTNTSYKDPNDTADFLAFSSQTKDSPGRGGPFTPGYASSPIQTRGSPYNNQRNWRGRSNFHKNRSFNHQDRSFNKQNRSNDQGRSNDRRSGTFNSSSNSKSFQEVNISQYIHSSFLEDPWAELEAEYRNKTKEASLKGNDSHNKTADSCMGQNKTADSCMGQNKTADSCMEVEVTSSDESSKQTINQITTKKCDVLSNILREDLVDACKTRDVCIGVKFK